MTTIYAFKVDSTVHVAAASEEEAWDKLPTEIKLCANDLECARLPDLDAAGEE